MNRITVLVADDHISARGGTKGILDAEKDMAVVGEASDGEEAVAMARRLMPDVAVLDIVMPRLDGIEATRLIKEHCPNTAVLLLSIYDDRQYVVGALAAGADGYLMKNVRAPQLVRAVREVHAGEFDPNRWLAWSAIEHHATGSPAVR